MTKKIEKLLGMRFVRYLVGGGSIFVLELGLFLILVYTLNFSENWAHTISYLIAVAVNFTLLKYWIFKGSNNSIIEQALAYGILVLINTVISNSLIALTIYLDFPAYLGKIMTMFFIIVWNFCIMKKVIFKERDKV